MKKAQKLVQNTIITAAQSRRHKHQTWKEAALLAVETCVVQQWSGTDRAAQEGESRTQSGSGQRGYVAARLIRFGGR